MSIKTSVHTLTATMTIPAGVFRPGQKKSRSWKVLDTKDLLHSLHCIKDNSQEDHTKNNIKVLIDQIESAHTDV